MDDLFKKYGNPTNKDRIYGPLTALALMDPLCMFVPYLIAERSPNLQEFVIVRSRFTLTSWAVLTRCQTCKILGSSRPAPIEAVNVAFFRILRGVANGTIKPSELPGELLEILQSEDLQTIYNKKELDEWYKPKGEHHFYLGTPFVHRTCR